MRGLVALGDSLSHPRVSGICLVCSSCNMRIELSDHVTSTPLQSLTDPKTLTGTFPCDETALLLCPKNSARLLPNVWSVAPTKKSSIRLMPEWFRQCQFFCKHTNHARPSKPKCVVENLVSHLHPLFATQTMPSIFSQPCLTASPVVQL